MNGNVSKRAVPGILKRIFPFVIKVNFAAKIINQIGYTVSNGTVKIPSSLLHTYFVPIIDRYTGVLFISLVLRMNPLHQRRSKVNGKFLQEYTGKDIAILGEVVKVSVSSNSFEIKTTDNVIVNVTMSGYFNELPDGWVEVRGIAKGKKDVFCQHYIVFHPDIFKDFDRQLFDDIITAVNTFNNPWVNSD